MTVTDHNAYSETAYGTCRCPYGTCRCRDENNDRVVVGLHRSHNNCSVWMAALFWIFFAIVFIILIASIAGSGCGN